MPGTPEGLSVDDFRAQARTRARAGSIHLLQAQNEIAGEYGFCCAVSLEHHLRSGAVTGLERALLFADPAALSRMLRADRGAATAPVGGTAPLLLLLQRSVGCRFHAEAEVRECARLLLDAGADPNGGSQATTPLREAVLRGDPDLVGLLVGRGATADDEVFHEACDACEGYDSGPSVDIAHIVMRAMPPRRPS